MPKRKAANGQGTIRQRKDGTWEGRLSIGRDPGTGKLKQKSFYGKTQAEVRKSMTAFSADLDKGIYTEPSKLTVAQWLDIWQKEYMGGVKNRTADRYESAIRIHIKPALGAVKLEKLTAPMIQSMYNQKHRERQADPKGKKGLSPKSIKNVHGVLHESLQRAVKLGYIRVNPCDGCELPRIDKHEIKPLTDAETGAFLQAISGQRSSPSCSRLLVLLMLRIYAYAFRCASGQLVPGSNSRTMHQSPFPLEKLQSTIRHSFAHDWRSLILSACVLLSSPMDGRFLFSMLSLPEE